MQRPLGDFFGRPELDEATEIHHGNALADVRHHGEIVGDEDVSEPEIALQFGKQVEHVAADRHIQRRHHLVAHDQFRAQRQRARNHHALLLAAGKLVRIAIADILRQADAVHRLARPPEAIGAVALARQFQRLQHGGEDRHPRVQRGVRVLEDDLVVAAVALELPARESQRIDAIMQDGARARLQQEHQRAADRGLARSGFADDAKRLAAADVKIDAVDRLDGGAPIAGLELDLEIAHRDDGVLVDI